MASKGGVVREKHLIVKKLTVDGADVVGGVLLTTGQLVDLGGLADSLVLDDDGDTTISAPTDDQIDFEVGGSDVMTLTATALTPSVPVVGEHQHSNQELTATGAITLDSGLVMLNHASTIIAATLDAPAVGDELYIINTSASGTAAHTVTTAAGVTWDGTNNTATLNAPGEALHVIAISATRWFILENIGSVGLSSV